VYAQLLKEEFAKHGTRLVTLNTRLDDSPEGELQGGILDQFAAYERAKIAERTRRGKLRKAREGKVVATNRPHYGFEYNTARDNYVVVKGEMGIVERIFRMVGAEKASMHAVKRTFENEGIPSPNGKRHWGKFFIRECIKDDAYRPHTREEIEAFVRRGQMSPEVASRLDPEERYGILWFNRHRTVTTQVAEQGTNGKRYRRRTKYTPSPKRNG
jgi:Resolvase, N terminal domain/Recombinase